MRTIVNYTTPDGRIRILRVSKRAPWRQFANQRGGLFTHWNVWDMDGKKLLAKELPGLQDVKRFLVKHGHCASPCTLRRSK